MDSPNISSVLSETLQASRLSDTDLMSNLDELSTEGATQTETNDQYLDTAELLTETARSRLKQNVLKDGTDLKFSQAIEVQFGELRGL